MFKKVLPKPTDVSCLGRAQICLHVYHHLRLSCCTELLYTSQCNSSVDPPQQPVQDDNPAQLIRETNCLVCQGVESGNNQRMAQCGTGALIRSSGAKNIGSQCMHYLGQLLQLRRWKSGHSVAPALGHVYPGNGGGSRDLKRFLEEVGTNPKEARYWLKQFQLVGGSTPSRPFAVVQVDQEIFQHSQQLKALSSTLAFLHRNDMKLLVVHGANLPDDKYLSDQELQNSRHQVTTETMVMVNFLEASGAPAHPIFSGSNVLRAENVGRGTKGKVINVNKEALEWCISSGHIPVLSSIGETSSSQLVSIDAAHATAEVAKAVQAMKVLFLNTTGGLRDRSGKIIEEVHIPADLDALMKQSCSSQDHRTKELVSGLVADLPPLSSVVITSARTILTELFTHHGSGTMFKKTERIFKYSSLKDVDIDRLKKLLTRSFGRVLKDNYFQELEGRLHTIYLSEGYSAAAIITQEVGVTIPYLDKFSISLQRQGEGTSDMLWNCVRRDFPSLFWRSRISNKVNAWYFKRSEGSWSNSKWTVFWYGISNQQLSYTLVEWAVKKPQSFHDTDDEDEWTAITESL
ncbi:N-acetylglutamate synthase, mitochondrial-like [Patiria miniata]|uniref:N-acetyltransferase domain-containing protein n=1 Tax=Patiria miniata TaxID=46514 RepID=A0A913ZCG6_PATMI|nr:N-acetylglutamate synthase, mitochondrial-like [Patiria miniata]XP_038048736.1 N-acetylglutamate synthase, mitochondrial-like [Patiria miniata]XP_038048737.1 N-acetylglutamate synthase, mitochondrial-like [Patiria miniata]XP_038048738.1 N-acetylglutamate synthase, mitochondrial-like [Patiria miniata]